MNANEEKKEGCVLKVSLSVNVEHYIILNYISMP